MKHYKYTSELSTSRWKPWSFSQSCSLTQVCNAPPPPPFLNLSLKRLVITYDLLFMLLLICIFHQLCKLTDFKKCSFSSQNLERPIRLWRICFVRHRITVCSWQCAEEDLRMTWYYDLWLCELQIVWTLRLQSIKSICSYICCGNSENQW